jgi:hypothetical protein
MQNRTTLWHVSGLVLLLVGLISFINPRAEAQEVKEKGDKVVMVDNPIYKHWAAFKVNATVTRREKVKFPHETTEGRLYPENTLVKDVTYKLLSVTPEKAAVEVTESIHHRGYVQESAPFKLIYSSHVKKGSGTAKEGFTKHKQEDVEVKVRGKTYKATLVETSYTVGPMTHTQHIWLSNEIPGGIVKDVKTQKEGDKVVTQSTLEVLSYATP